ncbi:hypothetical protein L1987_14390 [Smallanthus sonchifolius]|uniref:Uncharacterized protein n=1 Tax=Smallanthus sonchifolius TaxID=185202 RepID=A0ACB9J3P9_9ASTR|nr:hypothetical protein L1987_14390 [Smallanthus sonchifolius]
MHDPFTVHPQSADDDLGNHTLANGQNTNWSFCLHITLRTRFYAHFYWNSRTVFFDVYNYGLGYASPISSPVLDASPLSSPTSDSNKKKDEAVKNGSKKKRKVDLDLEGGEAKEVEDLP